MGIVCENNVKTHKVRNMKTLEQHLSQYAEYHRDQRNILTHYFGIPLIVFAVLSLLSRPMFFISYPIFGELIVNPALLAWLAGNAFYLKLDRRLGLTMVVLTGALLMGANMLAMLDTFVWLSTSIGIFVGGWVLQFIGHYYEGKKPAFVDDLMGLVIGPLFVVAELSFQLGLRRELQARVESTAGPVH